MPDHRLSTPDDPSRPSASLMPSPEPRRLARLGVLAVALVLVVSMLPMSGGTIIGAMTEEAGSIIDDPGNATIGSHGVYFEKNLGQFHPDVMFKVHGAGMALYLTANGAAYVVGERPSLVRDENGTPAAETLQRVAVFMNHTDALPGLPVGLQPMAGMSNYLRGNDASEWITHVPHYAQVLYPEVYPGISMVWYFTEGRLKYDFMVAPGGDPSDIVLSVDGASSVSVDASGRLVMATSLEDIVQDIPYTYQDTIDGRAGIGNKYVVDGTDVSFEVGEYDAALPLVIDPMFYSTFLPDILALAMTVDAAGNAYLAGVWHPSYEGEYPTTSGAYQETTPEDWAGFDATVAKIDAQGAGLVYATYLGGTGPGSGEEARGVAVDAAGNAYIVGVTDSHDFPTTPGAFISECTPSEIECNAGQGFVSKLSPDGSSLVYSTYLGGRCASEARDVALGEDGSAYVTGWTRNKLVSTCPWTVWTTKGFPTTSGAYQTSPGNVLLTGYVAKLDPSGSNLVYSTLLGPTNSSDNLASGSSIAVDSGGNAIVTGYVDGGSFPVTSGAFQTTFGGDADYFVSKLDPSGTSLVWSTYLGGSGREAGIGSSHVALDEDDYIYIASNTPSSDFPTTSGAYHTSRASGGIVVKLAPGGAAVYSTYLDYAVSEIAAIAGQAIVVGGTPLVNYPVTSDAEPYTVSSNSGDKAAFVTRLNSAGSALVYSTLIDGPFQADDYYSTAIRVALDADGSAYVLGRGEDDFPTTAGVYSNEPGQFGRILFKLYPGALPLPQSPGVICATNGVTVTWSHPSSGPSPDAYRIYYGTSNPPSTVQEVDGTATSWTHTPPWTPSTYYYQVAFVWSGFESAKTSVMSKVPCDLQDPVVSGNPQSYSWRNTIPTLTGVSLRDTYSGLDTPVEYGVSFSPSGAPQDVVPWTGLPTQPGWGQTTWWTPPSWSPSTLWQGTNYVNLRVEDRYGNQVTTPGAYVIQFDDVPDSVSGLVARTAPAGSLISDSTWQTHDSPYFEWTAATSTSPITGYSHSLSTNATDMPPASVTIPAPDTSWDPGSLPDGKWIFKVQALDEAGNAGPIASRQVWIDTQAPSVPIINSTTHYPENLYYSATSMDVSFTSLDANGVAYYRYDLYSNPATCGTFDVNTRTSTTGLETVSTPGPFVEYVVCATAVDPSGKESGMAAYYFGIDTVAPTFTDRSPAPGSTTSFPLEPIEVSYQDTDGGDDTLPSATTVNANPAVIDFIVNGEDIIAQWYESCAPQSPNAACELNITEGRLYYQPMVPWPEGFNTVDLTIQDVVVGPNPANTAWYFWVDAKDPDEVDETMCTWENQNFNFDGKCEDDEWRRPNPKELQEDVEKILDDL